MSLAVLDRPTTMASLIRIPALRLVRGESPQITNGVFAVIVTLIGVAGLSLMLIVNVALTQGAFDEASLTREVKGIEAAQQSAQQTLAMLASPGNLESRARAMGMVPAASPVFLRLADGKVIGKAEAASGQTAPQVISQLMPTSATLLPELQMAPAATKAQIIHPTSDAAVELTGQTP